MNTRFFYRKRKRKHFCSIVFRKKTKGDFYHENEKCKNSVSKALANVSLKLGKMSADSACCYIFHQPKMPETLKKLKKS